MTTTEEATMTRPEMACAKITLDGDPAGIRGIRKEFAVVFNRRTGESYAWAWPAVERVILKGGNFKS